MGMALEDAIWLMAMSSLTLWVIQNIVHDWDKPLRRDRWRSNKLKRHVMAMQCRARNYLWSVIIPERPRSPRKPFRKRWVPDENGRWREESPPDEDPKEKLLRMLYEGGFINDPGKQDNVDHKWTYRSFYTDLYFMAQEQWKRHRTVDCCMQSMQQVDGGVRYDSDSFQIAIDNCATSCFTNSMTDFVSKPKAINHRILGIGSGTSTFVGTVQWFIVDDQGRKHTLIIPGT